MALASSIGTFIEYYDLGVYGLVATTLAPLFLPSGSATASLLSTFAVFAVAFIARPIGGLFFGHFGDKLSRRSTLAVSLLLMALGTAGVGVLPTYGSIGVFAPLLLVVCRTLQGFATGREFSGATSLIFEYASRNRRALYASPLEAASALPFIAALLIILPLRAALPAAEFSSWAWRIPFLIAAPLGLVVLVLRFGIEDSAAFPALKRNNAVERAPLVEAVRTQYRSVGIFIWRRGRQRHRLRHPDVLHDGLHRARPARDRRNGRGRAV